MHKVLVFADGEKVQEAKDAGADFVGTDEYVEKIQKGWMDFDAAIATPDTMRFVGKLGKILGPRGLMPNPKTGTVTMEVGKAVKAAKAGKIDFKVDKTGIIHAGIGRIQFDANQLFENAETLINTIIKLKPSSSKGKYVESIYISSTMSPSVKIEEKSITAES